MQGADGGEGAVGRALWVDPEVLRRAGFRHHEPADRPPDWDALLSGSTLSIDDAVAGMVVARDLRHGRVTVEAAAISDWLAARVGRTLFLAAEAGEGKSSFLNHLSAVLRDRWLVVRWVQAARMDFSGPVDFRRLVAANSAGAAPPRLLVVADLVTELTPGDVDQLTRDLVEREADPATAEVTVLFVGRPGWLGTLRRAVRAELLQLAPIGPGTAAALAGLLVRAHGELVAAGASPAELADRYPNLRSFLDRSPAERAGFFAADRPMLASMLRAVYGERFHSRLVEEYERLGPADRRAYLHVCEATVTAGGVSDELLTRLVPDSPDLDRRARHDPWTTEPVDRAHVARHPTVAQTVLEAAAGPVDLQRSTEVLLRCAADSEEALALLGGWLKVAGTWNPVAEVPAVLAPAQIQRAARDALSRSEADLERVVAVLLGPRWRCADWARTLYLLLPEGPRRSPSNLLLVALSRRLVDAALLGADGPLGGHQEQRLQYWRDKLDMLADRLQADEPTDTYEYVMRWSAFIGQDWCANDFYSDLCRAACRAVDHQLAADGWEPDDDVLFNSFLVATAAMQHLRRDHVVAPHLVRRFATLMGRQLHRALPVRKVEVLRRSWQLSLRLGVPDIQTGMQYDTCLLTAAAAAGSSRERAELHRARVELLTAAVGAAVSGEPLFRMAVLAQEQPGLGLRPALAEAVADFLAGEPTGLSAALAWHARALLPDDPPATPPAVPPASPPAPPPAVPPVALPVGRVAALREACRWYETVVLARDDWLLWGEPWRQACRALTSLDHAAGTAAAAVHQRSRARLGG